MKTTIVTNDMIERCRIAKEKGWTYDPETGVIKSSTGKQPKGRSELGNYIKCNIYIDGKTKNFRAHQFAFYVMAGYVPKLIDHIEHTNDEVYDTRWSNLRDSDHTKNQWNRPGAKGYYFNKAKKKYQAQIRVNKKTVFLGHFSTEEEARAAYLAAKKIYHII